MPYSVQGLGKSKFTTPDGGEYDTLRTWCYEITATAPNKINKGRWGLNFPVGTDIATPGDYKGMPGYELGEDKKGRPVVSVDVPADTMSVKICFVGGAQEGKAVEMSADVLGAGTDPKDWIEVVSGKKLRGPAVLASAMPGRLDWLAEYEGAKLGALLARRETGPLRPLPGGESYALLDLG